jgi:hypothetical protein
MVEPLDNFWGVMLPKRDIIKPLVGPHLHRFHPATAILALASVIAFLSVAGISQVLRESLAQDNSSSTTARYSAKEFIIRYSRLSGEEPVGFGVNTDYAEVSALAFQGLPVTPDKTDIQPLFKEVADEMRAKNFDENLALLSLIEKYKSSSKRLLASTFFEQLQERKSSHGFARAFVVRLSDGVDASSIIAQVNRRERQFRAAGFQIRASPVTISPVTTLGQVRDGGVISRPVPACDSKAATVAIIGDQFESRKDLPQLSRIAATEGTECDMNEYKPAGISFGTNLAGVIANACPSCKILGFDAGCGFMGVGTIRSSDGAPAVLSAILRGVQVTLLTTADTKKDSVYDAVLSAAITAGVAVIAPAGDNASRKSRYPAAFNGVLGVSANKQDGRKAGFSNYGPWLVSSALGVDVVTTHKETGTATFSGTALAAARVAGFVARYLALNPKVLLPNLAVLAASGVFSAPDPAQCPNSVPGGSNADSGTGSDSTKQGDSGSGTGPDTSGGNGDGSRNGSGANSGGSAATPTATPTTTPTTTPTATPSSARGSEEKVRALAILGLPDSLSPEDAGQSPFARQKFQSQQSTQTGKVGIASSQTRKVESFLTKAPKKVADVVFQGNSQAATTLQKFSLLGSPTEIDRETKEYLQTIAFDQGTDIRKELANVAGVVGVYVREDKSNQQTTTSSIQAFSSKEASTSSTVSTSASISTSSVTGKNEAALGEMGWNADVKEFTGRLKDKVKVAIVSTGADYESPSLKTSIDSNLLVTSSYVDKDGNFIQGDFPSDLDGFGTQVASLLGHQSLGVAREFIEILPIKVALSARRLGLSDLTRGISLAVNKGAEVIVLPHDFATSGCDPVLGHAIYKAREKGVVFVIAAGDGLLNSAKEKLGFPIVAARDDGPASYEATSTPACWSRYFLGALSFAASEGFAKPLPDFSNYGDDIELSAMGVGINTVGLKDSPAKSQGTAFSAAWGAAAAAMAIAHHKTFSFKYGAWYIENLLVASATRDPNAMAAERRNRFGSLLNFTNLVNLLVRTESMTDSERRNGIETINPRQGDGWKPGEDKANLKYVALTLGKSTARPGEEVSYKVVAYFRSGEERDVTSDATYTRISIQAIGGKKYIELLKPGTLKIEDAEAFKLFKGSPTFTINANFSNEQAQGFDSKRLRVDIEGKQREVTKLTIQPPKTPVRVGQEINLFSLTAEYSNGSSEDATGGATWSTSVPGELRASVTPGLIDSRNAVAGKTYTVSASFGGKTAEISVTVVAETLKSFYVHNYLGIGGKIERGQKVTLEARMILSALGVDREQAIEAVWFNGSTRLNGGTPVRSLTIDTSNLPLGTQTYKAVATFRTESGTQEVTATISFVIADEISRIEIHMKTPIIQVGQPFFIDLRAYRNNNSYVVVTEDTAWSTNTPQHVTINRSGVGFISDEFAGNTLTIRAEYKGQIAEIQVGVIRGSVVTGSNSLIDYLTLHVHIGTEHQRYCYFPPTIITAKYKDGAARTLTSASRSFAERDDKGGWKDATLPLFGGREYRASVTYNDGSAASGAGGNSVISALFVMPKKPLDTITFNIGGESRLKYIMRKGGQSRDDVASEGVCELSGFKASPEGLYAELGAKEIRVKTSKSSVGSYTVTTQGEYTGMGIRELKQGSFDVDVLEPKPVRLEISGDKVKVGSSTFSAYGARHFDIRLFDANNRIVDVDPRDIELQLTVAGRPIDLKNDPTIRMGDPSYPFTLRAYPKSFGQVYTLTARHKQTNLAASETFTDVGSWESSDPTPWKLPSEEPEKRNETIHPACAAYLKNPTGLEYAGGKGTVADPLVVCDKMQLVSVVNYPDHSSYCKTVACTRSRDIEKRDRFFVLLGANIDYQGNQIAPIKGKFARDVYFDGGGHSISNYVIVDSEADDQALFGSTSDMWVTNLTIENPTVRGRNSVAAFNARNARLENVQVIGGVVWGQSRVGGVVVSGYQLKNVRVFGTEVRYESSYAGGIAVSLGDSDSLLFSGRVAPAGVVGGEAIGGVAGITEYKVTNVLMKGDVISVGANQVGGIAGFNEGLIVNSLMTGNVVSTGVKVGGIVGRNSGVYTAGSFGLDRETPNLWNLTPAKTENRFFRRQGLVRAKVSGSVWGGMSRKQFECISKVALILGVGGSTNCIGDVKRQNGGLSNVGGIAGINTGLIQDSEFTGTVRGINAVGGIAGSTEAVGNFVRNTSAGVVSASEGASEYGALIGYAPFDLGVFQHRLDSNVVTPRDGNPTWTIGVWGTEKQVAITSNVPERYDRPSSGK